MSDFSDGLHIADRLHALERRSDEFERYILDHETNAGAHAAAFAAHGMSPGVVADAEETAEEILENAADVAEVPVDVAQETPEVAQETVEELTDAVEDLTDAVESFPETSESSADETADAAEAESEHDDGELTPEREPRREHVLHKKLFIK